MIWLRNFGWAALAIVTLAAAVVPDAVTLPEPDGAIVLDGAIYLPDHGDASQVSLPYAVYPPHGEDARLGRFVIGFDLTALPHEPFFIFIPSLNRRASLIANGETLFGFEASSIWTGPLVSTPLMVLLPHMALKAGRNELMLVVEAGPFAVPTYLSKIYLGGESALAPAFKLRSFLDVQLKIMAIAAHILLGLGLIFAYFFRPKDPLFFWLAVLNVVTAVVAIEAFCGYQPALRGTLPFIIAISPAMGVVFVSVAMSLINLRPPKMMGVTAITIPCLLLPLAVIDSTLTKMIVAVITIAVLTAGYAAATGLLAWGAIRQHSIDARMMLAPTLLITWYAMRDVYITVTLPHNGFYLLTTYPRPLYLAFITAVLMRRMGVSLDQVDRANETLNIKLDEREAELAVLSRKERIEAAHLIRDQERQRLTHDLHDGISGHLASIIALSERAGDKLIEQAAREALNDLRLVIYSLDLGDRELPLALANFRERLIPQLHRLGIELDWSIAGLPEVSGVTPGNALAVLRILQEAITNALKHGPARNITIRGVLSGEGMVAITVENDGRAFVEEGHGHGLNNMRRRAQQLRGKLILEPLNQGTKVTLLLPPSLPDFEDEAVT